MTMLKTPDGRTISRDSYRREKRRSSSGGGGDRTPESAYFYVGGKKYDGNDYSGAQKQRLIDNYNAEQQRISSEKAAWDLAEATRRREDYLKSKYGENAPTNTENIQKKIEEAHKEGVYEKTEDVERSRSESPVTAIEVRKREDFREDLKRVEEIKSGIGPELTKPELEKYKGSFESEFVEKEEREFLKRDLSSQYAGKPFVYDGKKYSGRAAGEKMLQLKEAGKWSQVVRRRQIEKKLERHGGKDPSGNPLVGGIEYQGQTYFGGSAADILSKLERGGQAKVHDYFGGMEIDMDLRSDNIPIVFGKATKETAGRIKEYDRMVAVRSQWERELTGIKLWGSPTSPGQVREKPDQLSISNMAFGGWVFKPKSKLDKLGLEAIDVSPKVVTDPSKKEYVLDLKQSNWPRTIEEAGIKHVPMGLDLGIYDLTAARYSEVRSIEREYKSRLLQADTPQEKRDAQNWKKFELGRTERDIGSISKEDPSKFMDVQPGGLARRSTEKLLYYGSKVSPSGIIKTVYDKSPIQSKTGDKIMDFLTVDKTEARRWSKRIHDLDAPGFDVRLGHRGRVLATAIPLATVGLIGAGGLGGKAILGKAMPLTAGKAAAAWEGGAALLGYGAIKPISQGVSKLTGSNLLGMGAGIAAGGYISKTVGKWRPVQKTQMQGLAWDVKSSSAAKAQRAAGSDMGSSLSKTGPGSSTIVRSSGKSWTGVQLGGRPVVGVSGGKIKLGTRGARIDPHALAKTVKKGQMDFGELAPKTPIESRFVQAGAKRAAKKGTLSPGEYTRFKSDLDVMSRLQKQKSLFKDGELSLKDVEYAKKAAPELEKLIKETKDVTIFGSKAAKQQMYKSKGIARDPADLDLMFKNQRQLDIFKPKAARALERAYGKSNVQVKGNMISTRPKGMKMDHAFDLHVIGESDPLGAASASAAQTNWIHYGYKGQKAIKMGGVDFMPLSEQMIRKGGSSAYFRTKGGKLFVDPREYRGKDIGDFIESSKTLIQSGRNDIWSKIPVAGKIKKARMDAAQGSLDAFISSRGSGTDLLSNQPASNTGWYYSTPPSGGALGNLASYSPGISSEMSWGISQTPMKSTHSRGLGSPSPQPSPYGTIFKREPYLGAPSPYASKAPGKAQSKPLSVYPSRAAGKGKSKPLSVYPGSRSPGKNNNKLPSMIPSKPGKNIKKGPSMPPSKGPSKPPSKPPSYSSPILGPGPSPSPGSPGRRSKPPSRPPSRSRGYYSPYSLGPSSGGGSSGGGYSQGYYMPVSYSGVPMAGKTPRPPNRTRRPVLGDPSRKKKIGDDPRRKFEQFNLMLPGLSGGSLFGLGGSKKSKKSQGVFS